VLAVFDAARRAGLSPAHRSSRYRSNKARDMRLGPMERWKECGSARVGCARARMGGSYGKKFFEFPLCRHGSPRKSQADIHGGELTCVATGRRMGGRICCLCIHTWLYR